MKAMSAKLRERMVTRTVKAYTYKCMTVSGREVVEESITLGNMENVNPEKVELILKTKTAGIFVQVLDTTVSETVYGMTEEDFIKFGKVIDR